MSVFDEDLDLTLPDVDAAEIRLFVGKRCEEMVALYERMHNQWKGVVAGELPRNAFDPKKFAGVKRALAVYKRIREDMVSVYGEAPSLPSPDMDETFFALVGVVRSVPEVPQ